MKKILYIAWKDLLILFHDKAALILMLAAPFALTLAMGAVSGAFSQTSSTGIQSIPLVIANQDQGPLGQSVVKALSSEELEGLFILSIVNDLPSLRQQVEEDQMAAGVIIPVGYSASILPNPLTGKPGPKAQIEIYANPVRPVSSGIVQSMVMEIDSKMETASLPGQIHIVITGTPDLQDPAKSNLMAYLAPAMAVFFLMYTATQGGRSILAEKQMGTLTRMLVTPTNMAQVLSGKVLSVFAAGFLQVSVLILAAGLIFQSEWGAPFGVVFLVAATAAAATAWGVFIASLAKTATQVAGIGTAIMLIFGVLGGSFIPTSTFSPVVRMVSKITPNAWAVEGFEILAKGGGPADLLSQFSALTLMTAILFVISIFISRQRWTDGFAR